MFVWYFQSVSWEPATANQEDVARAGGEEVNDSWAGDPSIECG